MELDLQGAGRHLQSEVGPILVVARSGHTYWERVGIPKRKSGPILVLAWWSCTYK